MVARACRAEIFKNFMNRGHLRHSLLVELAVVGSLASVPALGAGGRRFKSSRPDHILQGFTAIAVSPFCLWVTVGGKIHQ